MARIQRMCWRTFKKNCKAVSAVGKCIIKKGYRYNDYCERYDCPKIQWAKRIEKERIVKAIKKAIKEIPNDERG